MHNIKSLSLLFHCFKHNYEQIDYQDNLDSLGLFSELVFQFKLLVSNKTFSRVWKTPPVRISYVNEGMLCKIKTKGRRQDGNKSGSGWVLWQISWWMGANCAIHQRRRLVEFFKSEFNWRYQNSESISLFLFAVLETDEVPNSCNGTIKEALRSLIVLVGRKVTISGFSSTVRNSHFKSAFVCFMFPHTVHGIGRFLCNPAYIYCPQVLYVGRQQLSVCNSTKAITSWLSSRLVYVTDVIYKHSYVLVIDMLPF